MKYRILTILFLIMAAGASLYGQPASEKRSLSKSFQATDQMTVEITNKYGKVHVSPSRSDSVTIVIELEATAANQSKLRKLVDGISFDLTSTNYFIIARSNFIKGPASFLESLRSITNNLISSDSRIEINYFVTLPPFVKVKIDNRYGDVFVESMDNDFDISLSNGSIRCDDLPGSTLFNLDFFDATFNKLGVTTISTTYGELNIKSAEEINFNTTASRIEIGQTGYMRVTSKRDRYNIKTIKGIGGDSYFTDFNIEMVNGGEVNLVTKYGTVTVDKVAENVDLVNLESDFTNIALGIPAGKGFDLDARLANCPVSYPGSWELEEKILNPEKNESLMYGKIGRPGSDSKIILDINRGKLVFNEK